MSVAELVDFGSTFTKVRLVDLDGGALLASAQSPTTVSTHMLDGFRNAHQLIEERFGRPVTADVVRASSSAAGGLRMVAVGLVPELTLEAATRAALGAGARVVGAFGFRLGRTELEEIRKLRPDMVLLAGGTEGGNREVVISNARALAGLPVACPVVMAGNKDAADAVLDILEGSGIAVYRADNVLPAVDTINVDLSRETIRDIFSSTIVRARGLSDAEELAGSPIVPTPFAVLSGASTLAHGSGRAAGLGELVLVDVGGATTDVHSVAAGSPSTPGTATMGIPEPYEKRTVEGDLGIRINAPHVAELIPDWAAGIWGEDVVARARHSADRLSAATATLPDDVLDAEADELLAGTAVSLAVGRHVGRLSVERGIRGPVRIQTGKDLTAVDSLIGTGGIFAATLRPGRVLRAALARDTEPMSLRPVKPRLLVDRGYCMFAVGLLAELDVAAAIGLGLTELRGEEQGD